MEESNIMVKCVNDQCENHDKIIKENAESCPVCGTHTEKYKAPAKTELGVGAVIASLVGILLFFSYTSIWWCGIFIAPLCVVVGFISRSKPAIVCTFITLAITVALFVNAIILA